MAESGKNTRRAGPFGFIWLSFRRIFGSSIGFVVVFGLILYVCAHLISRTGGFNSILRDQLSAALDTPVMIEKTSLDWGLNPVLEGVMTLPEPDAVEPLGHHLSVERLTLDWSFRSLFSRGANIVSARAESPILTIDAFSQHEIVKEIKSSDIPLPERMQVNRGELAQWLVRLCTGLLGRMEPDRNGVVKIRDHIHYMLDVRNGTIKWERGTGNTVAAYSEIELRVIPSFSGFDLFNRYDFKAGGSRSAHGGPPMLAYSSFRHLDNGLLSFNDRGSATYFRKPPDPPRAAMKTPRPLPPPGPALSDSIRTTEVSPPELNIDIYQPTIPAPPPVPVTPRETVQIPPPIQPQPEIVNRSSDPIIPPETSTDTTKRGEIRTLTADEIYRRFLEQR